jgi:16S rRNA processing protein RimM
VPRDRLPPPEQGEYYLCDLVGATVRTSSRIVGEVTEVRVHPSVDTLVIRAPDGKLFEQVIAEPWIESVDVEAKLVELSSEDGLI